MISLVTIIEDHLSQLSDEPRAYIGASSIGNPCERAIWYVLNESESKKINVRQKINFDIGKSLER